ncbi:hypothetical protein BpHYR1_000995 [Brachionus plicatilis]|uniref:MULE transposase domain-containing protein n=1 Tax=Brachionus plicatilis TaxID=10195 RepID=A0A3M7TDR4_BRAPC|nr:hypothetical protein BpHYR1_000995 [Brachionus plicatilis]
MLPNKEQTTYSKFFRTIKSLINKDPKSVNVDFEKAVFNALSSVFPGVHIYGCYFHLTQNFWRKMIKIPGFLENFYKKESKFKDAFFMCKSLCYVPQQDVRYIYKKLKAVLDNSFLPFLDYVGKYYIENRLKTARFPIPTWNLYCRVLDNLPRTNNTVECWHNVFTTTEKKHLTIFELVEKMRLEQSHTENNIVQIRSGLVFERNVDQIRLDKRIFNLVLNYDRNDCLIF